MTVLELWTKIKDIKLERLKTLLLIIMPVVAATIALTLVFLLRETETPAPAEVSETPPVPEETVHLLVTQEQLAQMAYTDSTLGELNWSLSEESLLELNRVLLVYNICTTEEISQFLAQTTVETAAGRYLTEKGDEEYFQSRGYSTGTRGAGYLHLTHEYGQMAFATWMMRKYVPGLEGIDYKNPANHDKGEIAAAYYAALQTAANLGLDISRYSRIVFDPNSTVTTGADYIAGEFAWESAGYYWYIAEIGEALSDEPGIENADIASERIGGGNWQSRREAYMAFYPILASQAAS